MDFLVELGRWFADPAHWQGSNGIPARFVEHVFYSFTATGMALAIALPIGLATGHTNRGGALAINLGNLGRAIPTFGIIVLTFTLAGLGLMPILIALTALAVPPILTNTYVGIRSVDAEVREAAAGMGMTGAEILRKVELPVALPLIMAGVRTSAVQVVATATLAAYVTLGGFGRYIFDGFSLQDTTRVVAGGVLVALLALAVELALGRLQAVVVPRGLTELQRQSAQGGRTASQPAG